MKKSKNYLIIALVVILIALAVGYAAFSQNLKITGTANANGTFALEFVQANCKGTKASTTATVSTVDSTNDTLTVSVTLAYPGDGETISVDILNNGTVDAKLTGVTVTETSGTAIEDGDIIVTMPTLATDGTEIIEAAEHCLFDFTVEWAADSEVDSATTTFDIVLEYEQSTEAFTGEAGHTTH